ncbi:cytochrome b [Cysteiniphilum sp. QT6929]|uniref:cytochrome b n=1 Tax=Cysteiniphilum sp. QT6929 TaxID=2975055 RepID=UPI0024B3B2DE|nr:cytochrome b [Cysteiniphilum sp. QT6929]WHN65028.1 cytochrome b [Cysteiniphilum sp. QT6929]
MKYNFLIRLFHLLIAIGVILQLLIGFFFDDLFAKLNGAFFMTIHKSIGLSLAIVVILLIITRLLSKKIPYPKAMSSLHIFLAKIVHFGLYLCVFCMSMTGLIASQLFQSQWQFFYWFNVPILLPQNPELGSEIFSWHPWFAYILLVFVILHIFAALYHKYIAKDDIVKKML